MSTVGEIVKTVLDVAVDYYENYGHKPAVLLIGDDAIDRFPPGRGILIKEATGSPEFTVNRRKILSREHCEVRVLEHTSAEREKLFADVETLLQDSSYSLIYLNIRRENIMKLFIVNMEVRLLN